MILNHFLPSLATLHTHWTGSISFNEVRRHVLKRSQYSRRVPQLYVFTDVHRAHAAFPLSVLDLAWYDLAAALGQCASVREAIVADSPISTAYSTQFRNSNFLPNYQVEVFSTKARALQWLYHCANVPVLSQQAECDERLL
jgi:hypothetical protein